MAAQRRPARERPKTVISHSLREQSEPLSDSLCRQLDIPLRQIARRAVRVWFNRDRLDQVLAENIVECTRCNLIYAIDADGRQLSSNIMHGAIDRDMYGQDLSHRPYSISLSVLNNAAFQGAFQCDTYISRVTQRPCITVMYGVTLGPTTLGFIAADLDAAIVSRIEERAPAHEASPHR